MLCSALDLKWYKTMSRNAQHEWKTKIHHCAAKLLHCFWKMSPFIFTNSKKVKMQKKTKTLIFTLNPPIWWRWSQNRAMIRFHLFIHFKLNKLIYWLQELNHFNKLKSASLWAKGEMIHPVQTDQLSPRSHTKSSIPYVRSFTMTTCPIWPSISSVTAHMGSSQPSPDGATLSPVEDLVPTNIHTAFSLRGPTETNIMKAAIRPSAFVSVSAPTALELKKTRVTSNFVPFPMILIDPCSDVFYCIHNDFNLHNQLEMDTRIVQTSVRVDTSRKCDWWYDVIMLMVTFSPVCTTLLCLHLI